MEIDSHEFQQDRLSLPMVCCVMCGAPPSAEVHNVSHDRAKMVTPITNYDFFAGVKSAYSPTHGALLEQIADLAGILITNAELAPDMRFQWQGAVDCYHVPLNDVESLRTVLATLHKAKGAKMISEDYIREDEDAIEFQNQVAKVMVAAGAQEIDLPKSVESRLSAEEKQLFQAILRVIDDKFWRFYADEIIEVEGGAIRVGPIPEETANAIRLIFADAVIDTWRRFKADGN